MRGVTGFFGTLSSLVVDSATGAIFAFSSGIIWRISVALQTRSALAGGGSNSQGSVDSIGTNAVFGTSGDPFMALTKNGNLYVSDRTRIRMVDVSTRFVTTLAGSSSSSSIQVDDIGTNARFTVALNIAVDSNDNAYVVDGDSRIRKITMPSKNVTTLVGPDAGNTDSNGNDLSSQLSSFLFRNLNFGGNGRLYATNNNDVVVIYVDTGRMNILQSISPGSGNGGVTIDSSENLFFIASCRIRQFNMFVQSSSSSLIAGHPTACFNTNSIDGLGATVRFSTSNTALAADAVNGALYITDSNTRMIRVLQMSSACSAGKWCANGSTTIDQNGPCSAGYYCPEGSDRVALPAGTYCTSVGLSVAPVQLLSCSAGAYCPAGSSTLDQGGTCPVGYFCASGFDLVACTAGKYCPPGSGTLDQGGPCAAGYYCPAGSERLACVGSYCAAGESSAGRVPCTPGYKCPGGGVVREQCTPGSYASGGASFCTECPRGLFNAIIGISIKSHAIF